MASTALTEIQQVLKEKGTEEGRAAARKFVPTAQKVYGVRMPDVNTLAADYKKEGIPLVQALWASGAFEERLLAAKLLGKVAKEDPPLTLELVRQFAPGISDWALCDTLGMQSIKPIAKARQPEVFSLSRQLLQSDNPWQRRLGIVLLEGYTKDKSLYPQINALLEGVNEDKEYYVKKALSWIRRNMNKH